jgi:hypothetical protein
MKLARVAELDASRMTETSGGAELLDCKWVRSTLHHFNCTESLGLQHLSFRSFGTEIDHQLGLRNLHGSFNVALALFISQYRHWSFKLELSESNPRTVGCR